MRNRNVWLYYLIAACQSAWFTEAVWFFYFKKFTDYGQMGLCFSILNICWILFEIPTGVIADKFGRKLSTVIGAGWVTLGLLITGLASGFWMWIFGLLIQNLGRAFISGALEALIYDDLKQAGREQEYGRIAANKSRIVVGVYAVAVVLGGFLGHVNLVIPYLLFALTSLISFIGALALKENVLITHHQNSVKFSIDGIKQFKLPQLRPFMLLSWLVLFVYFVFDWGFAKPAMGVKFGFYEREQGVIFGLIAIINVGLLQLLPKLKQKLSDQAGLYLLNMIAMGGFLIAVMPLGRWGFLPIMIIEMVGTWAEPWVSTIINQHIESKYRATTLSALQMFGRIPYLLINPVVGLLVEKQQVNMVFIMMASIIAMGIVIKKRYT